jgi:hypothetical protein
MAVSKYSVIKREKGKTDTRFLQGTHVKNLGR